MKIWLAVFSLVLNVAIFAQDAAVKAQTNSSNSVYSESIPYVPGAEKDSNGNPIDVYGRPIKEPKSKKMKVGKPDVAQLSGEPSTIDLPVFVYDKDGKPVTDLKPEDFTVFADEDEQNIAKLTRNPSEFNLIIAIDASVSAGRGSLDLRSFATKLAENLRDNYCIKVVSFNEKLEVLASLSSTKDDLRKAIKRITSGGGTSLYEATQNILEKQLEGPTIVLLLSDGVDTTSERASFESSLEAAEQNDAILFPFYFDTFDLMLKTGVNGARADLTKQYEIGRSYLLNLATISGGRAFEVKDVDGITEADLEYFSRMIKPQYHLRFKFNRVTPNRRLKIKVRVNRPNLSVQTRGSRMESSEN